MNRSANLESFLRARLSQPLPGPEAHRRLAPRPARSNWVPGHVPDAARQAAALILLYGDASTENLELRTQNARGGFAASSLTGGISLPLTVRRRDLPHHPGQISLPGGRVDHGETAEAAALREAHEEIGVDPSAVRIVGRLTPFFVLVSNFVIQPFVGVMDARPEFRLAEREVESLIEVPVDELSDPTRVKWGKRTREGYLIDFPFFDVAGHQVWGATAMILAEFVALFEPIIGITNFTVP